MSSGGGGQNYYPQDNSLAVAQFQAQQAKEAQAAQDAKDAQAKADFVQQRSQAAAGARSTGLDYLSRQGLSADQYGSVIDQIIADQTNKVPNLDPNPSQYFTSDIFSTGLNNYQDSLRAKNNANVNSTFAPGFENTYIPDSSANSIIDAILGEQSSSAQQQLNYQKSRGLLNDTGYNTAQNAFSGQQSSARSTITDLANSVLKADRGDLTNIRSNAGQAASSYTLGTPNFDIGQYVTQARSKADADLGGLEGAVRSAVGSTNYFDIPSILAKAGTAQGPQNLTTAQSIAAPFGSDKKNNTNRGLGSTGNF